jgi:hypothetical protein
MKSSVKIIVLDVIFILFIFFLFSVPFIINGNNYYEEYSYNLFSLEIYSDNYFNPFLFFYDLIGPGTKFPIGNGLFFLFPTIFFIKNKLFFYLGTILFCFIVQFIYLNRLFLFFKIEKHKYILCFLHIFNITGFCFLYSHDWIAMYITISLSVPIFYYSLNFIKYENKFDFYKLITIISFATLNGHAAYTFIIYIFILLIFILNRSFFFLKTFYFYIGSLLFFFIIGEDFYRILNEYLDHKDLYRPTQWSYGLKDFFSGVYLILQSINSILNLSFVKEFDYRHTYFLSFSGIVFYFAVFESFRLIIIKQSYKFFYINIIFLFFIFFSHLDILSFIKIISGPWLFRDIYVFLSIFIFGIFLLNLKQKYSYIILLLCCVVTFLFYYENINLNKKIRFSNFLHSNQDFHSENLFLEFQNNSNNNYTKTYISPGIYEYFSPHRKNNDLAIFSNSNIFTISDLVQYKIYPFNYFFKTASKNQLIEPEQMMYADIKPEYNQINNQLLFSLFRIENLMIFKSELNKIQLENFSLNKRLPFNNDELLFFKNEKMSNLVIKEKYINTLKKIKCNNFQQVYCYLNNNYVFDFEKNISLKRINSSRYHIYNSSNSDVNYIVPFLYDKNWKSTSSNLINIGNTLMVVKLKAKGSLIIEYSDQTRFALKLLSLFSFFSLLFYIFLNKTYS